MMKAGLVAAPGRGRFIATDAGKALLATNPARIDVEKLKEYPAFRAFYMPAPAEAEVAPQPSLAPVEIGVTTPEEQIEAAFQASKAALGAVYKAIDG
jgi:restriction system protein